MRAGTAWPRRTPGHGGTAKPTRMQNAAPGETRLGAACITAFLLGYLPGILLGRGGTAAGAALAAYYMDKQSFAAFGPVFLDLFAGAFLQSTIVLLCGFCALGAVPLAALFAVKGTYLGFCAANVFAAGGAKGLVAHWLITCLPDLGLLLLLFSLTVCAGPLCAALLRTALGGAAPVGILNSASPAALTRTLLWRYGLVLAASAACCALGAGSAVFFAAILL